MRVHLKSAVTIAAMIAGASAGSVFAQGVQAGGGLQAQQTGTGTAAQGEIGVQKRAAVSPEEQLAEAEKITRRATQLAERMSKMLDEARREKDILRANCVNRKLTEVNANTRNVEQRGRALRDAAAAGDEARRSHEYTVLTVLAQKLNQLDQEATQCLGQSVYEPGAAQVVTTVAAGAPSIDPSTVGSPPPPPASVSVPPPTVTEVTPTSPTM